MEGYCLPQPVFISMNAIRILVNKQNIHPGMHADLPGYKIN